MKLNKPFLLTLLAGAAAAEGLRTIAKSKTTRNLAVKGLARGLQLTDSIKENFENLKEDAQDVYTEARMQASLNELETALAESDDATLAE